MTFRFGIVGGGWYGCHIASSLSALGISVKLFEKSDRLMHEASGNNQFRLHLGFHYPRHAPTRLQSRDGHSRFVERYPTLSRSIAENIYAVPKSDSLMDFQTYRIVMTTMGVDFAESDQCSVTLTNIDGFICTSERVLLLEKARTYFREHLGDIMQLGVDVQQMMEFENRVELNGEVFDFIVDATWGHLTPPDMEVIYEPTILLYFEGPKSFPAVTMVDGPLCSIYPTEMSGIYTLSSVPYTPLGRFKTPMEARIMRDAVGAGTVDDRVRLMSEQVIRYVPSFSDQFRFLGPQLAIKTKPVGAYDDRSCYVRKRGRVFSVLSGKIDTVFFAVDRILALLELEMETEARDVKSALRDDIARQRKLTGLPSQERYSD